MKKFIQKYRIFFIILGVLIFIYITFPMAYHGMYPGKIFHLNIEEITAIEITNHQNGDSVVIENRAEITALVEQLNARRYAFWSFHGPLNLTPDILHIYRGIDDDVYFVGPHGISDGLIVFFTDMEFITDYLAD